MHNAKLWSLIVICGHDQPTKLFYFKPFASALKFPTLWGTYSIDKLSHHAIPSLCIRVTGSIFSIADNLKTVGIAYMLGNLCCQLHTIALIAVIALELVGILLEHHIRIFLVEKWGDGECGLMQSLTVREDF